ncbi:MAG: hypothetical protein AAF550_10105 [Myxococcota bacterium]
MTVHNGREYKCIVCILDGLTKFCHVKAVFQETEISDRRASDRPQSGETTLALEKFVDKVNRAREEAGLSTLQPKLVVRNDGSEFKHEFASRIKEQSEEHPSYWKETSTPGSRSRYNSMSARLLRTARRYFKGLKNADETDLYTWVPDVDVVAVRINTALPTHEPSTPCNVQQLRAWS